MFKDIPISLSELEIFNELIRLEYPVLQVRRLYDKLRHPLQTCAIDLTDSHQARTILKLDRLFHSIIKVQPKSNRFTPVQCKNCQRFGHSQANCKLKPRCVKCSQPHHYSVCPKPQSTPPTCVNCGQTHSANYRGCSFYKLVLNNKINKSNNNLPSTHTFSSSTPTNNSSPSINSYSTIPTTLPQNSSKPSFNLHTTHFPPLSNTQTNINNSPWTNNLHIPTQHTSPSSYNIQQIITTIISQILSILLPQLQNIIESLSHNK